MLLPPADSGDEFLADFTRHRAPGEQMFRAVNLGSLAKDGGRALPHEFVGGNTERGVGRNAAVGIRATAVHCKREFGNRLPCSLLGIDTRQHFFDRLDR